MWQERVWRTYTGVLRAKTIGQYQLDYGLYRVCLVSVSESLVIQYIILTNSFMTEAANAGKLNAAPVGSFLKGDFG